MKNLCCTINEHAKNEGVSRAAIRARIRRGTCITKWVFETEFVIHDRTINKSRKKKADEQI